MCGSDLTVYTVYHYLVKETGMIAGAFTDLFAQQFIQKKGRENAKEEGKKFQKNSRYYGKSGSVWDTYRNVRKGGGK